MFADVFIFHTAFFHYPPRSFVFLDGDRNDPLETDGIKTIVEPCNSTFVSYTSSPKFRCQAITDLDLACIFKRLQSAATDRFARFLPDHRALAKTEFLVTFEIKIQPFRDRFRVLHL